MNKLLRCLPRVLLWLGFGLALAACAAGRANEATPTPMQSATLPPMPTPVPTPEPTPTPAPLAEIIDYELRGAFAFFWEQANTTAGSPGYGLVRDRYPGAPGIASIASVGFALTAYPIGVEYGYVSRADAHARADGTLDTLLAMARVEGFFYHFVDIQTGARAWQSEVSSIDTAILMLGVLTAGDYFGGDVQRKAQQLYADVNWPWMLDPARNMFYMAYKPGEGHFGHWDFYAEQLMLYVLAAGSPTHPVDETPYYTFIRHSGRYGDGERFIHSWFGSIFTYQFSHAWIDFRQLVDREGVNWFDNSVAASLAHVAFASDNAARYATLGPDAWGLTASDGPDGYNGLYGAPPSGYDNSAHRVDDTVPPAGAIGSIIFVPEAAAAALQNYYAIDALRSDYGYGFVDAYNLSADWFASDVIGIDKGISLLMLANYERDLVHTIVMQNAHIMRGLDRLGLRAP